MFGSNRRVKDEMEIRKDRTVRFHPDEKQNPIKSIYQVSKPGGVNQLGLGKSRVFSEDHEPWRNRIFDPGSEIILKWNYIFLVSCLVALFIDPLYFYLPSVENGATMSCIKMDKNLNIIVTFFRSLADLFYILHMVIKFRTAYVAPSSSVFGRGVLVMDPKKIAWKYLTTDFFVDLAAALPLPQIVIWLVILAIKNSNAERTNNARTLALVVLVQYVPRLYLIFPLSGQIVKATGVVTKTAWAGAVYNLLLYLIASHVAGAAWYLLSAERQTTCWRSYCGTESSSLGCESSFLNCDTTTSTAEQNWANSTQVFANCDASNSSISFNFGLFTNALTVGAVSSDFLSKYLYCSWWGLQNLSCFGQNLTPSSFIEETSFSIAICIVGLVLFSHLLGNMQTYLQSVTIRLEEWRLKRRDTEEWMKHRQLPHNLRHRVRRFVQYKWLTTRGVDEVAILKALPSDLRRDIQHHLCLDLIRRVPFFSQMDDLLLDAICERLVSSLCTEGTYIVREGDPVNQMLFIIRGRLESSTTNGGRTGFFNSITLRPGDFCGEELLTWALLPKSTVNLPTSTRTVRALVEVEAFALRADDLKFVANQFRRLHSKKLQHTFRFYSHNWRTWAACFIQAAWRRFKRRRMAKDLCMRELSLSTSFASSTNEEESHADEYMEIDGERLRLSTTDRGEVSQLRSNVMVMMLASKFAASTRKGAQKMRGSSDMPRLQKPDEPDFFTDAYD